MNLEAVGMLLNGMQITVGASVGSFLIVTVSPISV